MFKVSATESKYGSYFLNELLKFPNFYPPRISTNNIFHLPHLTDFVSQTNKQHLHNLTMLEWHMMVWHYKLLVHSFAAHISFNLFSLSHLVWFTVLSTLFMWHHAILLNKWKDHEKCLLQLLNKTSFHIKLPPNKKVHKIQYNETKKCRF